MNDVPDHVKLSSRNISTSGVDTAVKHKRSRGWGAGGGLYFVQLNGEFDSLKERLV